MNCKEDYAVFVIIFTPLFNSDISILNFVNAIITSLFQ